VNGSLGTFFCGGNEVLAAIQGDGHEFGVGGGSGHYDSSLSVKLSGEVLRERENGGSLTAVCRWEKVFVDGPKEQRRIKAQNVGWRLVYGGM